jgi:hypothetical protein
LAERVRSAYFKGYLQLTLKAPFLERSRELSLFEARDLLEKAAGLVESAGWPGIAVEIGEMAIAVAALQVRRPATPSSASEAQPAVKAVS